MQPIYKVYWLKKKKATLTSELRACRKEFKKKRLDLSNKYWGEVKNKRFALSNKYWGPPAECAPTEIDSDSSVTPIVVIDVDSVA